MQSAQDSRTEMDPRFVSSVQWFLPETDGLIYFWRFTSMIKPTVGRSLHFFAGSDSDRKTFGGPGPFACILAGVISDECINVGVFTNEGAVVPRTRVALLQGSEITSEGQSFCAWMPFQSGQAQVARSDKTEVGVISMFTSVQERLEELELLVANPMVTIDSDRRTTEQLETAFAAHQAKIAEARRDYEEKRADGVGVGLTGTPEFQAAQAASTEQLRSLAYEPVSVAQEFEPMADDSDDELDFADEDDSDLEDDSDE